MRIAVVGGGTAGCIAATQVTHALPDAELLHIYDSRIPRIGVGEGTTPRFPRWLETVAGLGLGDLEARCDATLKHGTRFEGWGAAGGSFFHRFQPVQFFGYHFDATRLVDVLTEHIGAAHLDAHVTDIESDGVTATVHLQGAPALRCDFVFDARGFPRVLGDDDLGLDWIPTSAAIVQRAPPGPATTETRAVARPHGWIFVIPLGSLTSCGYIHDPAISAPDAVQADFDAFFTEEGVAAITPPRTLRFPNFVRRAPFDGSVFRVGNAAGFVEPLEATAIGTAIVQARAATRWIREIAGPPGAPPPAAPLAEFNRVAVAFACRNALFLAWHYARGSRWDTPFWRAARTALDRARRCPEVGPHLDELDAFLDAGARCRVDDLAIPRDHDTWVRDVFPRLSLYRPFGNFSELNFAQVGHGIGYYQRGDACPS